MKTIALAALAAATLAGAPAFAADFTFEIPVTIENVPNGEFAEVSCFVSKLAPGTPGPGASAENTVGRATKRIDLVKGAFHGKVVVEFNAEADKKASDGKQWKCYLSHIAMKQPNGSYKHVNAANPAGDFETATGLRVARLAKEFSGPLP